jgi:chorismate lyase/3-hydroxybenzoate synthase
VSVPESDDLLLVGGTSSVRGEDSVHVGKARLQLAETLENLAALVRQAFGPVTEPLAHYRALRVYYSLKSDLSVLRADVERAFPSIAQIEWQQAELCRGDLLVEIEGLAGPV